MPNLSDNFFQDQSLRQSYADYRPGGEQRLSAVSGEQVTFTNLFAAAPAANSEPLLNPTIREQLGRAESFNLSTAAENQASGRQPDYRVVEGENGQLVLEKVGDGDPLADGELNIEMDTKGKSLQEALAQADKGLKEYYRELIAAWQVNHPGTDYPGWWNDILHSQPDVPADAQPVPIRQANTRPQVQPQERQPQPGPSRQSQRPQSGGGSGGGGGGGGGGLPFLPPFGGTGGGGGDGSGAGFDPGGRYRSGAEQPQSGAEQPQRASSGATPSADQQTVINNVKAVTEVAREVGVDPQLAVAMMLVESGGDNRAVGDNGTSFGLFQLHRGGMLTEAGLTRDQAFDPTTNARVSLTNLARIDDRYADPGRAAAASQRPADPAGYARRVNASMDEAAELIAMADRQGPVVATTSRPESEAPAARTASTAHSQARTQATG